MGRCGASISNQHLLAPTTKIIERNNWYKNWVLGIQSSVSFHGAGTSKNEGSMNKTMSTISCFPST